MFVSPINYVARSNASYKTRSVRNNDTIQQPVTQEATGDKVSFKSFYTKALREHLPLSSNSSVLKTPFMHDSLGEQLQKLAKGLFKGELENCSKHSRPIIESLINNTNKPLYKDSFLKKDSLWMRFSYIREYMEKLFPENKRSSDNFYRVDKNGIFKVSADELNKSNIDIILDNPNSMFILLRRNCGDDDKAESIFFNDNGQEINQVVFSHVDPQDSMKSSTWSYVRHSFWGGGLNWQQNSAISSYEIRDIVGGSPCRKYFDGVYKSNGEKIEKFYNSRGEEVSPLRNMWNKFWGN